eukprot:1155397-Pelagomonas_calceolata.AAC.9
MHLNASCNKSASKSFGKQAVQRGIIEGCNQSGCSLLGGETAEMPGFYKEGEYDLAGFAVGSVKQDKLIDGKQFIMMRMREMFSGCKQHPGTF